MKKLLTSLIVFSLLVLPVLALAQIIEVPEFSGLGLLNVLYRIRDYLFTILIIAGYTFVTAQGDPEKVIKARKFVLYALIGAGVGVASWGLVALVLWVVGTMNMP